MFVLSCRQRSLGLAWEKLAGRDRPGRQQAAALAEELLSTLAAEFVDATVLAALAELFHLRGDMPHSAEKALDALRMESAGPRAKVTALLSLGFATFFEGRFSAAANHFTELTWLRRDADDWYFLGMCEHKLRHDDAAISALTTGLQLDPARIQIRELLAEIYHSRRELEAEKRLRDELEKLNQRRQK